MKVAAQILFFFFLFSGLLRLHAQIVPYQKYTSKDGLLSDRITAIAQDKKGFMWFGSYFGICGYDGIRLKKLNCRPYSRINMETAFWLLTIKFIQVFYQEVAWSVQ
jgi:ligand-binding sensor domain-containing protein